jgi:glycosyltransferase involved in cell wall biosynthesis
MPPTLTGYEAVVRRPARLSRCLSEPEVTLITVTLNSVATLARTITSVQAQTFLSIEHVVVDGGSTDGTIELLKASLRPQDYWISEPDFGISDAMNKGVALARGSLVQFVHADDWLSRNQVEMAVNRLKRSEAAFVFGDLIFYEGGRPVFEFLGDPNYTRTIARRMPSLNHPTVLLRKACFARIGMFDLNYRCAMDYDWFLRLHRAGELGVYDPAIRGHMNHDGFSNTQFHRTLREVREISVKHGRALLLAWVDELYHHTKTSIGRLVKARARPAYNLVRQCLNPSFRPLD